MAAINRDGFSLDINPLFKNDNIGFLLLSITEEVGGSIPTIRLKFRCDYNVIELGEKLEINISCDNGSSLRFECYVVKLSYVNMNFELELSPYNKEFFRDLEDTYYVGYDSMISTVFPGEIDSNCQSDVSKDLKIHRYNETGYALLRRSMSGYKYNSIWAFTLDGLKIRDLSNWSNEYTIDTVSATTQVSSQEIVDHKLYNEDVEVLEVFTNHIKMKFYNEIIDVDKDYELVINNKLFNSRLSDSKSDLKVILRYIPMVSPTMNVFVESKETDTDNTYVSSRRITIDGSKLDVELRINSINS